MAFLSGVQSVKMMLPPVPGEKYLQHMVGYVDILVMGNMVAFCLAIYICVCGSVGICHDFLIPFSARWGVSPGCLIRIK